MTRRFLPASLLILCLVTGCVQSSDKVGSQAPDFTLEALENKETKVTLSQVNAENPVLLIFWATWCPSCVDEIPALNEWSSRYASRGLKILAVNVEESRKTVERFVKQNPVKYQVLLDEEGDVAGRYGLVGLPVAILLAKGGGILYYSFSLPSNLDQLLN